MDTSLRDTPAAATRVGLSQSYLEKLRVRGGGPQYLKIGRVVKYRDEDLEAWIASHLVSSTSERRAA